jgi:undecaprenyl-diphosphatase
MDLLQTIILGFIQGLTEWLPVSSTGHLRIAERLMGLQVPLLFDVSLHVATLLVILLFFRADVKNVLVGLGKRDFKSENGKLIPLIVVGTVPTALLGVVFGDALDRDFNSLLALGAGFIVSAVMLFGSRFSRERKDDITYVDALLIGIAQGTALIPSISRSGTTIALALLLGIRREKAFKFSFLLSIPAVIGALGLTLYQQSAALTLAGVGLTEIIVGFAVAVGVSFPALKLLWRTLANKKFHLFAFYCLFLGLTFVILGFVGF